MELLLREGNEILAIVVASITTARNNQNVKS
jgi:high-affinity Fe2+/Pb2+ permease